MSDIFQKAKLVTIDINSDGQRIDNFLFKAIKKAPRSFIYRILRKGEVRVNKKRAKPSLKLVEGDIVRIPPVFIEATSDILSVPRRLIRAVEDSIVFEDEHIIFINKQSGLAVHGGTGQKFGLIECFRQLRPKMPYVELVHRLDKETSGLVMLAKSRGVLIELHEMLKEKKINKRYKTLVIGKWLGGVQQVNNQLQKQSGKQTKMKVVHDVQVSNSKRAESIFYPIQSFTLKEKSYSLLEVELLTGRMHQIRTQLADKGYPIIGDSQYGDFTQNRIAKKELGLKRLFLHAFHVHFQLKSTGKHYNCKISLADDLTKVIERLA